MDIPLFKQQIFSISRPGEFGRLAMELFRHQARHNLTYQAFLKHLGVRPESVSEARQIPFLPVELFKSHKVWCAPEGAQAQRVFTSSGTTGAATASHHIADLQLYENSFSRCFGLFYGKPENLCILALLPGYLERKDSSLVYMAKHLVQRCRHPDAGFFLHNHNALAETLGRLETAGQPTLLLGVSFALWDFAEKHAMPLKHTTIMETGGMKGKRPEILREQLHHILADAFEVAAVHSEYGMTELLSQAYSTGGGVFRCPPWMRVCIREATDPMQLLPDGKSGAINVIDLANVHSCAFLALSDLGRVHAGGSFEVLGRMDNSDVRGCNLMV